MTNYEKIKNSNIEEVAKFLEQMWFGNAEEVKKWLEREAK